MSKNAKKSARGAARRSTSESTAVVGGPAAAAVTIATSATNATVAGRDLAGPSAWTLAAAGCLVVLLVGWSYWPDLGGLIHAWNSEPDYSHGFLVLPIAAYCLWARKDSLPGELESPSMGGFVLIAVSVAWRILAEWFFLPEVATWSLIPLIGGICWLMGGRKLFLWALPAITFLLFMMKLPFRAETMMGIPLRRVSCHLGSWMLQCLGYPAVPEYTTIRLGDEQLEVAQACAGLRMFIGVFALVAAYLMLVRRPWWQKLMLLLSIVPIAVVANSIRILFTGMAYQWVSTDFGKDLAHDMAGWLVIPLAAVLFAGVLWYLDRALIQVPMAAGGTSPYAAGGDRV